MQPHSMYEVYETQDDYLYDKNAGKVYVADGEYERDGDPDYDLTKAVCLNDVEKMKEALESGAGEYSIQVTIEENGEKKKHYDLIDIAAANGSVEAVDILYNADNYATIQTVTVALENRPINEKLLKACVNAGGVTEYDSGPGGWQRSSLLAEAIEKTDLEAVKALVNVGANLEGEDGHDEEKGFNINESLKSAAMKAESSNSTKIVIEMAKYIEQHRNPGKEVTNETISKILGIEIDDRVSQSNGENKMEKVTLIPTDENSEYYQEHIAGRHGKDSTTIGSKLLDSVSDGYMLELLKKTDQKYQELIDEKGLPGRVVFAVEADRPVGTNALYPIENLSEGVVFSTTREPGTDRAAKIKVALISENDMPTTNVAQVIMGHYGPTGKAGIYTAIFGDEGMPFAENIAKRCPDDKEFIGKCQEYWDSHVMLVTPKELEANIAELKSAGMPTKAQELALKSFQQRGKNSPIIKPFVPEISPNAVKMQMLNTGNKKSNVYE